MVIEDIDERGRLLMGMNIRSALLQVGCFIYEEEVMMGKIPQVQASISNLQCSWTSRPRKCNYAAQNSRAVIATEAQRSGI